MKATRVGVQTGAEEYAWLRRIPALAIWSMTGVR
jgi:hypothetical protein